MTLVLLRKLLRDIRLPLFLVALLLAAFQCLWARVTDNISDKLVKLLQDNLMFGVDAFLEQFFKEGPARILQTLMGGENIDPKRAMDMLSIGYVHPLTQTILCVWAIGRAAGAIAGEIDRGTMELLLAQPISRSRLLLAHLLVDALVIPVLCLSMWAGTYLGAWLVGLTANSNPLLRADPWRFGPGLFNVAALMFAVSGLTMWLSAAGRFRNRVLGLAVLLALVQFLVNVIGQLWPAVDFLRPFTLFFYYQPQPIILDPHWYLRGDVWQHLGVLLGTGLAGYLLAWWILCRRDLPAPL